MSEEDLTLIIRTKAIQPDPPCVHLPKGTPIEGFEITELLGVGGFGLVYKAWDSTLEREVALKEYLPESLAYRDAQGLVRLRKESHKETFDAGMKSFVNEAKLLARFDHSALIKVFRFWESNGTAYMVMPYYKGLTLKALQTSTTITITEQLLLNMILPIGDALQVMHQQQCIHRDVSPDNVIVQEDNGMPILLDFGAARRAIGQCGQSFTVILKSGYAPIEQYAEIPHFQQGPWTDVYALAALAHYLIRGKAPAPAVGRMVHDTYLPLAEDSSLSHSKQLLKALDWGLQIEPDRRPQSMHEFRIALTGLKPSDSSTFNKSLLTQFLSSPATDTENKLPDGFEAPPRIRMTVKRWIMWVILAAIPFASLVYSLTRLEPMETGSPIIESQPAAIALHPFDSILQSADPEWNVQIDSPQSQLQIDKDLLRLSIQSTQEGYLSVWVESPDGSLDTLVGPPHSKPRQVRPGENIQVPDISEPLLAGGPAGKNRILVIVSESSMNADTLFLDFGKKSDVRYGARTVEIEQIVR